MANVYDLITGKLIGTGNEIPAGQDFAWRITNPDGTAGWSRNTYTDLTGKFRQLTGMETQYAPGTPEFEQLQKYGYLSGDSAEEPYVVFKYDEGGHVIGEDWFINRWGIKQIPLEKYNPEGISLITGTPEVSTPAEQAGGDQNMEAYPATNTVTSTGGAPLDPVPTGTGQAGISQYGIWILAGIAILFLVLVSGSLKGLSRSVKHGI